VLGPGEVRRKEEEVRKEEQERKREDIVEGSRRLEEVQRDQDEEGT